MPLKKDDIIVDRISFDEFAEIFKEAKEYLGLVEKEDAIEERKVKKDHLPEYQDREKGG